LIFKKIRLNKVCPIRVPGAANWRKQPGIPIAQRFPVTKIVILKQASKCTFSITGASINIKVRR
jgi:hypothetical protein